MRSPQDSDSELEFLVLYNELSEKYATNICIVPYDVKFLLFSYYNL